MKLHTVNIYSACWVSLVVKNTPAMRETWILPLGWEDPLEKGKATHSSILAERIPEHGVAKRQTGLSDFHFLQVTFVVSLSL